MNIDLRNGLKVGGHVYSVKSGGVVNERLKEGEYYARCYYSEREILVDNSRTRSVVNNSVIHEILHAIDNNFDTKLRESQIKRIANGLHQVTEQFGINFKV